MWLVSGGSRINCKALWPWIPPAELLNLLSSLHGEEVITLQLLLWRVTRWDSDLPRLSKWMQNDPQCSSRWFVIHGLSPWSPPCLCASWLPQLQHCFCKKAFPGPTDWTRCAQHILTKSLSFVIVLTFYHYVLEQWLSSGGSFVSQGTYIYVWRHLWRGVLIPWIPQGCC